VLAVTAILLAVPTVLFLIFERDFTNEGLGFGHSLLNAIFDSATARTAGFNSTDTAALSPASKILTVFLMFIGGSPGSTAGGIKTTTIVVLILLIRAYVRGDRTVHVHQRTIPDAVCREAMVLFVFYLLVLFIFFFILCTTEKVLMAKVGSLGLFYEVSSAFGTVGTSLNATTSLTPFGRGMISIAMFLGRIGPLSVALMMAGHRHVHRVRYPEESVSVG
jgi:trk system potassium uptake protein TrkH